MQSDSFDSIRAEYPFLENFWDGQIVSCVLAEFDEALLNSYSGELVSGFNSDGNFISREKEFYFLDKDGTIIVHVGYPVPQPKFTLLDPRTWFKIKCNKESVADAICRIGAKADTIHYVLTMHCQEIQLAKVPATFANAGEWYRSVLAFA